LITSQHLRAGCDRFNDTIHFLKMFADVNGPNILELLQAKVKTGKPGFVKKK